MTAPHDPSEPHLPAKPPGRHRRGPLDRNHWSGTQFVLLAGGGFTRGRVVGATDADGMKQAVSAVPRPSARNASQPFLRDSLFGGVTLARAAACDVEEFSHGGRVSFAEAFHLGRAVQALFL